MTTSTATTLSASVIAAVAIMAAMEAAITVEGPNNPGPLHMKAIRDLWLAPRDVQELVWADSMATKPNTKPGLLEDPPRVPEITDETRADLDDYFDRIRFLATITGRPVPDDPDFLAANDISDAPTAS